MLALRLIVLLDLPIQDQYLTDCAVVFHNEVNCIVLVLHAGKRNRTAVKDLVREILIQLLLLRHQFLFQLSFSKQVWVHSFVHYQFDHELSVFLWVFFEIRYDVG